MADDTQTAESPRVYNLVLDENEALLLGLHSVIGVAVLKGDTASASVACITALTLEAVIPREVKQSYASKMLTLYKLVRQRIKEKG